MKLIIAGNRDFNDYYLLCNTMSLLNLSVSKVVSGGARGADALGERWAIENNILIKRFPADWNKYGKRAGILRNESMAQYADGLLAFHDGIGRGTANMIMNAQKYNLFVHVVSTDDKQLSLI